MAELEPYDQLCLDNLTRCLNKYKKHQNKFIVDIGCSFNSWFLNYPFMGLLIDYNIQKIIGIPNNNLYTKLIRKITPYNVCDTMKEYNIPKNFYCLNLDTDGYDLFTLIALLRQYSPQIIITEINEKIPYPVKFSIKYDPSFDWGWCHLYGYSIACLEDVMKMFNYSIDSLNYNNIILIKNTDSEVPNIDKIEQFYKDGYLNNKVVPIPSWNKDVNHLQDCKTKEEVAEKWRDYFLNNPNPNNGKPQTENLDKYVINDAYEIYLQEFLKSI